MHLSSRVTGLKPSATLAVANLAASLKRRGVPVLSFAAGEPDFDSPQAAKDAAAQALANNDTRYLPTAGDPASRQLVAQILTRDNHIPDLTPDHVAITTGVKMALYLTFQALFDHPAPAQEPDELLLPVPAWVSFAPMAQLAGARVVPLPTTPESDFKITPAQLKAAISPRARALVINSPSNPCGTMYSPDELGALAAVVADAAATTAPNLVVVADELYQKIVFGPHRFMSIGSIPGIAQRTLTVNGPAKAYAMTGWRLGWVSGSGDFGKAAIDAIVKLQGQTTTAVTGFSAAGMRAALTSSHDDVERMRLAFARRAQLIHRLLSDIPGLRVPRPDGAFYAFPDISHYLGKSTRAGLRLDTP
ncbi:MAG: aspartate aminotransferase, partial [Planctomyces sp.]|nr:aspartate aminotransferase [Planctomyces sp.]